jgi:transcriptional regulator with XRE-family HTH domain
MDYHLISGYLEKETEAPMKLEKLHETMDRLGVKPEALAQKTGLSFSTIQKARRGHSVTLGTATLIALGMKMKKEDLV